MSVQDFVQYFIEGSPVGCVYALVAVGITLTYKTSGVFNLAFGAQAFLSAAVMYEIREGDILGIGPQPMWLCLIVSVFIVAPLFGLLLDRALFRYMRNSTWVVKLVSSLGLFVALPGDHQGLAHRREATVRHAQYLEHDRHRPPLRDLGRREQAAARRRLRDPRRLRHDHGSSR